jgi:ribosomal protein S27E
MDAELANKTLKITKYAVYLHIVVSAWMYGSPSVLRSYDGFVETYLTNSNITIESQFDLSRALVLNAEMLYGLLIVLLLYRLAENLSFVLAPLRLTFKTIGCFLRVFFCLFSSSESKIKPFTNITYLEAVAKGIRMESYRLSQQPKFQDAFIRTETGNMLQEDSSATAKKLRNGIKEQAMKRRSKILDAGLDETPNPMSQTVSSPQFNLNMNEAGTQQPKQFKTVTCPGCRTHVKVSIHDPPGTQYSCPLCSEEFATPNLVQCPHCKEVVHCPQGRIFDCPCCSKRFML